MTELHARVRERLRAQVIASGGSPAFEDPALFADVEALLHTAASTFDSTKLILPELLGDPDTWRLNTAMRYQSHRNKGPASVLIFVKRRVLMPLFNEHRNRMVEAVRRATPEQLDQPLERAMPPMFTTAGELANFLGAHTAMHAGQISVIRRSLGRPPIM